MQDASLRFNQENPELGEMTVEETAQGWETKVLAQIKDKQMRWSASGYVEFGWTYNFIKNGMARPIDDFVKASKFAWGKQQKEMYLNKGVWDAIAFEGKQYYIPMKLNVHVVGYRSDWLNAAGYGTFPKTWDEVDQMIPKLKPVVEKEKAVAVGISSSNIFRTLGTSFTTVIDKPFDEEGMMKIESPEWIQIIELYKKWKDMGMARLDGPEHGDVWQKGGFAFSLGSHSLVRLGRQVWGSAKVNGARPPQATAAQAQSAPRTWIHVDSAMLFNEGPHAQHAVDWMLSVFGPEGNPATRWWTGVVNFSGQPSTQVMVDKALKDNAGLKEVYDVMQLVPNSFIMTVATSGTYSIIESKIWPHLHKFFNGEVKAKEAMAAATKDIRDELAKRKA